MFQFSFVEPINTIADVIDKDLKVYVRYGASQSVLIARKYEELKKQFLYVDRITSEQVLEMGGVTIDGVVVDTGK